MRRLILLLALVLLVTACSPSDPWRMWWGKAYAGTDLPWEPKELFPSRAACEAARRKLPEWVKKSYATVCVPEGLTPKDIGRD